MTRPTGYSLAQIRLHWVVFVLVALQFILHDGITDAWDDRMDGLAVDFDPLAAAHVIGGLLILALVAWRLVLRVRRGAPPAPEAEAPALKLVASLTHGGLYLVMILMVVSGAAAWFGGVEQATEGHKALRIVLFVLILLHLAGALYQQFILRTNLLDRMRRPQN